jgi:hypothetical protein
LLNFKTTSLPPRAKILRFSIYPVPADVPPSGGHQRICSFQNPASGPLLITDPHGNNAANTSAMSQDSQVTAAKVIDQIRRLSEAEQVQVIHFVQQLAQARTSTTVEIADPPAVQALKKQIKRGQAPRRAHA